MTRDDAAGDDDGGDDVVVDDDNDDADDDDECDNFYGAVIQHIEHYSYVTVTVITNVLCLFVVQPFV